MSDGRSIGGKLVVGADGANSFVREHTGIAAVEKDYGQTAVVANFSCEKAHSNTALQWFQGGRFWRSLRFPAGRSPMIWSLPHGEAERICGLEAGALCREVEAASRHVLGSLSLITRRAAMPASPVGATHGRAARRARRRRGARDPSARRTRAEPRRRTRARSRRRCSSVKLVRDPGRPAPAAPL